MMQRVLTFLVTATLLFSGHAAAVCARDCADGASLPNRASTGKVLPEDTGSCHGEDSTPPTRDDRAPLQAPRAPRPQNCVGHSQLSVVARPVARIVTFVPHAASANAFWAFEANGQLLQRPAFESRVSSASPPSSGLSPRPLILRI